MSKKFYEDYYRTLKGGNILDVEIYEEDMGYGDPELWLRLKVKTASGQVFAVEVSRDEEGNGPGFLFGLPMPKKRGK